MTRARPSASGSRSTNPKTKNISLQNGRVLRLPRPLRWGGEATERGPSRSGHRPCRPADGLRAVPEPEGAPEAEPQVQLSYRVDDIAAAVERVRAAGGRAGEPERKPYGLLADCEDNQGATFRLWQPAG